MRSQGFKSGNAQIRGMREKKTMSKINWDRIVYLFIVNALLLTLGYIILSNMLVATGDGRVIVDRFNVRFASDVHIDDIMVQKGDTVQQYQELFIYSPSFQIKSPEEYQRLQRSLRENLNENFSLVDRELMRLRAVRRELKHYRQRLSLQKEEVKLNLTNPAVMFETEDRIISLESDSMEVVADIRMYRERGEYYEKILAEDGLLPVSRDVEMRGNTVVYQSPVYGIVEQIFKTKSELAVRSESILSLRRDSRDIMIRAIFERDDLNYLDLGKEVNLKFDNGTNSKGIIDNVYAADIAQPDATVNRDGVAITQQLVVEIRPSDPEELLIWETNSGISLKVRSTFF